MTAARLKGFGSASARPNPPAAARNYLDHERLLQLFRWFTRAPTFVQRCIENALAWRCSFASDGMRTREEYAHDFEDHDALFHRVVALLDARRAADPTMTELARLPGAVLWGRRGHLFFFQQGSGRTIGFGQLRWRQGDLPDRLHQISIVRSRKSPSLFQLNDGPDDDIEVIAAAIVDRFSDGPASDDAAAPERPAGRVASAWQTIGLEIGRLRAFVHCRLVHGCTVYERANAAGITSVRCPMCGLVFWRVHRRAARA